MSFSIYSLHSAHIQIFLCSVPQVEHVFLPHTIHFIFFPRRNFYYISIRTIHVNFCKGNNDNFATICDTFSHIAHPELLIVSDDLSSCCTDLCNSFNSLLIAWKSVVSFPHIPFMTGSWMCLFSSRISKEYLSFFEKMASLPWNSSLWHVKYIFNRKCTTSSVVEGNGKIWELGFQSI